MKSIVVSGVTLSFAPRYAEGHALTANEAATLNQTLAENLRNNTAAKVKEMSEAGSDAAAIQAYFDEYAKNYQFGVRTGGGRTADPVERKARELAGAIIENALKENGYSKKAVGTEKFNELVANYLDTDQGTNLRKQAEKIVAQERKVAGESIDMASLGL